MEHYELISKNFTGCISTLQNRTKEDDSDNGVAFCKVVPILDSKGKISKTEIIFSNTASKLLGLLPNPVEEKTGEIKLKAISLYKFGENDCALKVNLANTVELLKPIEEACHEREFFVVLKAVANRHIYKKYHLPRTETHKFELIHSSQEVTGFTQNIDFYFLDWIPDDSKF